jgi:sphingolipid delta-4 desaturase
MAVIATQFFVSWYVKDLAWWKVMVAAYVISGTLNQNLFTAQHEISHYLAFRTPSLNRWLAIVGNLPLVVPVAVKFREYHHDHHLFLGVDGGDVDLPTLIEARIFNNTFMKVIYGFIYLVFYGVRPLWVRPKKVTGGDVVNWILVMGCNAAILYFWGLKSLVYLFAGSILGGGLHPLAGHLIAEHYQFEKGQETYSYYGPLNLLSYNVGYHNEHHDFPQIPHTRLYRLKEIAPEYYTNLYQHTSWTWVIWKFISDPKMGPWSRMHRASRDGTEEGNKKFVENNCVKAIAVGPGDAAAAIKAKAAAAAKASATDNVLTPSRTTRQTARAGATKGDAKHVRSDSALENVQPAN